VTLERKIVLAKKEEAFKEKMFLKLLWNLGINN